MKKVAGYIQRKTMLYETGVEYGDYTMNHVLGCAHGCNFPCYAFYRKSDSGKFKHMNNGFGLIWCRIRYNFFNRKYQN